VISPLQKNKAVKRALGYFAKAGIVLSPAEKKRIEVADFGLSELEVTGLQILTYINTKRCCAKELVLFPRQTCPEHLHPSRLGLPGKEETFRCRWGRITLHVPGKSLVLKPGEQYTLPPGTLHWFQAGPQGAVVSEFSTSSHDASDRFTDPRIRRMTKVKGAK
jgi:D-lyxose ketol-isomerase